jgi:nucleotide-binding universal stress UspA family protein
VLSNGNVARSHHGRIVVEYDDTGPAHRTLERAAELAIAFGARVIVQLAEHREADLIVAGTREPGVIERMLGLSVSGAVQRKAHCDVLAVHEG